MVDNQALVNGHGGGVYSTGADGFVMRNTIVANNQGPSQSADGRDIYGPVRSADFNLIEDISGAVVVGDTAHTITAQDPMLGELRDNGGKTLTHAPALGSPVVDAGSCEDIAGRPVLVDQRDAVRPQGLACDMGAYESPGPHLSLTKSVDRQLAAPGGRIVFTIAVGNQGEADVGGGTISDTLPASLSLAGPIVLEPQTAGSIESFPEIVRELEIPPGGRVTVTFPVTVSVALHSGVRITNTATAASPANAGVAMGSCGFLIATDYHTLYLPMVMKVWSDGRLVSRMPPLRPQLGNGLR